MTSRRKTKGKGRKERLSCRGVIGGVGASALGAMIKQGLYNARFAWGGRPTTVSGKGAVIDYKAPESTNNR